MIRSNQLNIMDGSLYDMLRNHNFNGKFLDANNKWQQISPISSIHIGNRSSCGIEHHLGNSNCNTVSGNPNSSDYVESGNDRLHCARHVKVDDESSIKIPAAFVSQIFSSPTSTTDMEKVENMPSSSLKKNPLPCAEPSASVDCGSDKFHCSKHRSVEDECSIKIPAAFVSQISPSPTSTPEMKNVENVPFSSPKKNMLPCAKHRAHRASGGDKWHCSKRRRVEDECSIKIPAVFVSQIISSPTSTPEMEKVDNKASSSPKKNMLPCTKRRASVDSGGDQLDCLKRRKVEEKCSIKIPASLTFVSPIVSSPTSTLEIEKLDNMNLLPCAKRPASVDSDNDMLHCTKRPRVEDERSIKTKSRKGAALTDFFTLRELRKHIESLRHNSNNSSVVEMPDCCQLCEKEKLFFTPPPIYCSECGACIKHNVNYYCAVDHCFCTSCYGDTHSHFTLNGTVIRKATLTKTKNEEKEDESWVQCDRCQKWQHQICALFNEEKNLDGKAEYNCPICFLKSRTSRHIPAAACFCAKDLPKSELGDHIEQRILRILRQERLERASAARKNYEEVPGVEDLTVRVVSSGKQQLKVGEKFLSLFPDNHYPLELPYDSKAIFMFQKIHGADVCIFAMYVQEFGSESPRANRNCVYISYIDSVKHLSPDIKSLCGESLRTIVYHNILLGYFEYCKNIGFTTGYIWSCPPKEYREEYIFYCHPENQKTPRTDILRNWYNSVLRKAVEEKIAVRVSNLHDHLFTEPKPPKPTAARLPYFAGAYWMTAAEEAIKAIDNMTKEKLQRRAKKIYSRRLSCEAAIEFGKKKDISVRASKHILLMDQIRKTILPVKEDFFVVSLRSAGSSNPSPVFATRCEDSNLGSNLFKTRSDFFITCEEKRYQFDSLRRAKHSTMMILYHYQTSCLQNPAS